jgi:hypothetical protein
MGSELLLNPEYRRQKNKEYYERNKDKIKQIVKKWESNNQDKVREMRNKNALSYYHRKKEALNNISAFAQLPFNE